MIDVDIFRFLRRRNTPPMPRKLLWTEPPPPKWAEYPVMLDGIPGFCALRVPHGTDIELVKKHLRGLQCQGAKFHG